MKNVNIDGVIVNLDHVVGAEWVDDDPLDNEGYAILRFSSGTQPDRGNALMIMRPKRYPSISAFWQWYTSQVMATFTADTIDTPVEEIEVPF